MQAALDEQAAGSDPLRFFHHWFHEAVSANVHEVNAMTLATADAAGRPHARIVLLKGADERGFSFFTNYQSAKGEEIAANPNVALLFFWKELERQVRIEGTIQKLSPEESDVYYHSRPFGSRIGAWASPQSQHISDRKVLETNYHRLETEYKDKEIPRPPHWGGYLVTPHSIEFWQGRPSRLHDRLLFTRDAANWSRSRLAP
jgi:pyridoxamine 5'-phosphate oxidase